jgi:CRP/FNR family transcriptional regulator
MLVQHMRFKTGERIHTVGQPFDTVYVVYSGFVRVSSCDDLGNEQVLNFPMRGDLFGLDGIHSGHYVSEAIALTECNLILLPFYKFNEIFQAQPEFEQAIFRAMSHELVREQMMIGVLGTLGADARVARFLMLNSERFRQLGWSEKSFNLSMTRRDIGSYLGLSLETVSRILSSFDEAGLIRVENRTITILNPQLLKSMSSVGSRKKRGGSAPDNKPERDHDSAFPAVAVLAKNARKRADRVDFSG